MSARDDHVRLHARRPILGAPLAELRPDSCRDMADTPRRIERARWSVLEALGAAALTVWWLYLLWRVIEGLAA